MSVQTTCPSCRAALLIPEEMFGRRVQCPTCHAIFSAEIEHAPVPPVRSVGDEPRPRYRPRREQDEHRGDMAKPHRGGVVLTLGILSLVMGCFPLGIAAWVMGSSDLTAMRRGQMDESGADMTRAGQICGIIGTIPLIIAGVAGVVGVVVALVSSIIL